MASKSRLGDLEYLINRYCEEHINPIFDQTVAEVRRESDKEFQKARKAADKRSALRKSQDAFIMSVSPELYLADHPTGSSTDIRQKWDWRNMSDDDIVDRATRKYQNNGKIQNDLAVIKLELFKSFYGDPQNYNRNQINELISKLPNDYLEDRIYRNFVRHAARYNIPKSKMSYIFHKIWNESMMGSVLGSISSTYHSRGSFGDDVDRYADDVARRRLKVNKFDDFVAWSGTAAFDYFSTFGFGGGVNTAKIGAVAAKGLPSVALHSGKYLGEYKLFEIAFPYMAKGAGLLVGGVNKKIGDLIYHFGDDEDPYSSQQHQSNEWFGGYFTLDSIAGLGISSKGHDMSYLSALSSELMNKTDLRSEKPRVESAIRSAKNDFLGRSRGSNQQLRKLLRSEMGFTAADVALLKKNNYSKLDYLWTYDTWMRNLSWQKLRNSAAYWAGAYHYMKAHGEKERNFSGKVLSLEDVGVRAMKYCNAADAVLSEKRKDENITSSAKTTYLSLRKAYDSHSSSAVNLVRQGLYKVGLPPAAVGGNFPNWMLRKTTVDCEKFALYYIARAEALKAAGKSKQEYQALATKAWWYAMASQYIEKDKAAHLDKSKEFNACQQQILRSTHGSNLKLLNIAKSEVQNVDKSLANSKTFSKGMMSCSWENLHRQAVYWTSVLRSMRENNRSTFFFGGRNISRREVADRVMRYCNGAAARLETTQRERKVVEQGRGKIISYQNSLLSRTRGSNSQEQKIMIADFSKWGKHKYSKAVPSWMTKMKWEDCHRQAAYYYGVARYIKENHLPYYTVGKQKMSFDDAAQRAYSYSLAAVSKLSAKQERQQQQQDVSGWITTYKNILLSRTRGSNYQEKNIMAVDFRRWGKKTFNPAIPKWMSKIGWETCHNNAAYYYAVAKYIKEHKLTSLNVGGKKMTFDSAAQLAWSYSKAAIENLGNKKIGQTFSRAMGHDPKVTATAPQPARRQQSRSSSSTPPRQRNYYEKSSSNGASQSRSSYHEDNSSYDSSVSNSTSDEREEKQNVASSVPQSAASQNRSVNTAPQNPNTVTYGTSGASPAAVPAGYRFSTPSNDGWFKYLSGLGLNGFSDVTHNMGYVLAMLPDLLISIFTGKANFSLKNNLLPLSLLTMGILMPKRNRMLKMLLMGLGGAQLLNNAGHRILGENPTLIPGDKTVKRYTTYADEPLDPRIKNPVLKADERLLMMDIDGVPYVIGISGVPIDAYNKKALPLNVLANAVLRQFDEKKQQAEECMANNLSQQKQESQEKERVAAVK